MIKVINIIRINKIFKKMCQVVKKSNKIWINHVMNKNKYSLNRQKINYKIFRFIKN